MYNWNNCPDSIYEEVDQGFVDPVYIETPPLAQSAQANDEIDEGYVDITIWTTKSGVAHYCRKS
jgi:hypothetical protein